MKKILLADDESSLRSLLRITLESSDCQVIEAHDGKSAYDLAVKEKPDLLVLDWMMPGLSGIKVLELLKNERSTKDIPVIMLTARGGDQDRRQAQTLGVFDYMLKPFSPLELLRRVEEALQER